MKNFTHNSRRHNAAFTLIELLVVIAVIAILAGLLFPITTGIKKNRILKTARAELEQMASAIEAYKDKRGVYPPDNPNDCLRNPLFFELKGAIRDASGNYTTLDGSGAIQAAEFATIFPSGANPPVRGFVNSSANAKGDDEKAAATSFLPSLKPGQAGVMNTAYPLVKVLSCSVREEDAAYYPLGNTTDPLGLNPWRYVSSNPTNNQNSYDLWVDIHIGNKKYTVSNWSKKP